MLYKLSKGLYLPTSLMNVFLVKGKAALLLVFFCVSCRLYGILPLFFPQPNKNWNNYLFGAKAVKRSKKQLFKVAA